LITEKLIGIQPISFSASLVYYQKYCARKNIAEIDGCFVRIIESNDNNIVVSTDVSEPDAECVLIQLKADTITVSWEDGNIRNGVHDSEASMNRYNYLRDSDEFVIKWT